MNRPFPSSSSFVVSGKMKRKHATIKSEMQDFGVSIENKVSDNTVGLIIPDGKKQKTKEIVKAEKLQIPILTETEFNDSLLHGDLETPLMKGLPGGIQQELVRTKGLVDVDVDDENEENYDEEVDDFDQDEDPFVIFFPNYEEITRRQTAANLASIGAGVSITWAAIKTIICNNVVGNGPVPHQIANVGSLEIYRFASMQAVNTCLNQIRALQDSNPIPQTWAHAMSPNPPVFVSIMFPSKDFMALIP